MITKKMLKSINAKIPKDDQHKYQNKSKKFIAQAANMREKIMKIETKFPTGINTHIPAEFLLLKNYFMQNYEEFRDVQTRTWNLSQQMSINDLIKLRLRLMEVLLNEMNIIYDKMGKSIKAINKQNYKSK